MNGYINYKNLYLVEDLNTIKNSQNYVEVYKKCENYKIEKLGEEENELSSLVEKVKKNELSFLIKRVKEFNIKKGIFIEFIKNIEDVLNGDKKKIY